MFLCVTEQLICYCNVQIWIIERKLRQIIYLICLSFPLFLLAFNRFQSYYTIFNIYCLKLHNRPINILTLWLSKEHMLNKIFWSLAVYKSHCFNLMIMTSTNTENKVYLKFDIHFISTIRIRE